MSLREKGPEESNNPYYPLLSSAYFMLGIRVVWGYFPPIKFKTFLKRKVLASAEISGTCMVSARLITGFRTDLVLML